MIINFEGKSINSDSIEYIDIISRNVFKRKYGYEGYAIRVGWDLVAGFKSGNEKILKSNCDGTFDGKVEMEIYKEQLEDILMYGECGMDYNEMFDYEEELNEKAKNKYGYGW